MKTTTLTQSQFLAQTNVPPSLARAVIRQMGGWENFTDRAPDIARHGIDGGFSGFIYYSETKPFTKRNRKTIAEMAEAQADDFGVDVFEMIQGFGCFRHRSEKPSRKAIATSLYGGRCDDDEGVLNALAWYAGEEVSHSYCGLTEQD